MPKRQWLWSRDRVNQSLANDELVFSRKGDEVTVSYKQYLLSETGEKRGSKPASIVDGIYTQHGTQELAELFDGQLVLQFPKPTALLKHLVRVGSDGTQDDLILDFFAGSCTTAQAVLELNREDEGTRRFIMVQLPEPTGQPEFSTITDLGKERIRRVVRKLKNQTPNILTGGGSSPPEDLGFKVFKLSKPHIQRWHPGDDRDPETYAKDLSLFDDPLGPGWTPENVLWEVALREGYGLNTRFEKKALAGASGSGNVVYEVSDPDTGQRFAVCLDDEIRADLSKHYRLEPDFLFVCRDKALDDTAAANLALQCRLKTI